MKAGEALIHGEGVLRDAGIEDYRNDAWLLFEYVTGFGRTGYFIRKNDDLLPEHENRFNLLLKRRAAREPVQYITGKAYFMGHEFMVNENVLIPRQDTEVLVENVLRLVKDGDCILDMCTGSGCILLSLLAASRAFCGVGSDLSEAALAVASENAVKLDIKNVNFVQGNLFENVNGSYNIIVSNPPYIRTDVIEGLMEEVRLHEPYIALDGHTDGLYFYKKITGAAMGFLEPDGYLCFEIGYDQGKEVSHIMEEYGFEEVRVIKDLAMLDRVVIGKRRI